MTTEPTSKIEFAALTDTGRVRRQNEDAVAINPEYGFALLADGMGGHLAGEVASGMAVDIIGQALQDTLREYAEIADRADHAEYAGSADLPAQLHDWMRDAIQLANTRILQAAHSQEGCRGMGTTLVLALYFDHTLNVAHAGDSRLYRLRGTTLQQLTRDHSVLQQEIAAGLITPAQALLSKKRNLITRALGAAPLLDVELHQHDFQAGDIALLCSDGLTDMVPDQQIADLLHANRSDLPQACAQLVACANACGGRDNVSVILMKARDNEPRLENS